ncbi:MAG: response regulator transcription factor [Pseudolabrys sp.]
MTRPLDATELAALTLFANGRSAEEIAQSLSLSKSMVQHHLRVATRKLGGRNRIHAVALAVEAGLVKITRSERS